MYHSSVTWLILAGTITFLLIFDLKFSKNLTFKKGIILSTVYIIIALVFGLYINFVFGYNFAKEYYTGYLIEKAMSLDNIFVIETIFAALAIDNKYRHRVLFWGILSALFLRALAVSIGSILIHQFAKILYFFALFIIITGLKIIWSKHRPYDIKQLYIYKYMQKNWRLTSNIQNEYFFVRVNQKLYATPLFIALILIEFTDIIFAVDSVPAIFAVTNNAFIVYSSNIMAILGLRALYICISHVIGKFIYLKYSLGAILIFIGAKVYINILYKMPAFISLSFITGALICGVATSLLKTKSQLSSANVKSDNSSI